MVVFSCDKCGDSLKKQQVERHRYRCGHDVMFCCIDCQKPFYGDEYMAHTKCVSEAQKYGGLNFVAKENKGEVKQDAWTEQVCNAIAHCPASDGALKAFMAKLADYPNVPRKEKKFINFAVNSISRDQSVLKRAWALIVASAPPKPQNGAAAETNGKRAAVADDEGAEEPTSKLAKKDKKEKKQEATTDDTTDAAEPKKEIKWKKIIRSALKSSATADHRMTKTALVDAVWSKVEHVFDGTRARFDAQMDERLAECSGVLVETTVRLASD